MANMSYYLDKVIAEGDLHYMHHKTHN